MPNIFDTWFSAARCFRPIGDKLPVCRWGRHDRPTPATEHFTWKAVRGNQQLTTG